jgi:predicted RNA-binding Zn ribbon-like protein
MQPVKSDLMVTLSEQAAGGQAAAFDLCGGHPVLDFVNSLDNRFGSRDRIEGLRRYDDLLRFTQQTGLLDSAWTAEVVQTVTPAAGMRALRAARALREALAATFYAVLDGRAPPPADLETLERCFHAADRHRELQWRPGAGGQPGLEWSWRRDHGIAEVPIWVVAHAARDLLLSSQMERVRACEADTCRWLFLDTSKSHTRRWCKMKVCGNRVKARRYQARHSA